jgi:hypothetical protein
MKNKDKLLQMIVLSLAAGFLAACATVPGSTSIGGTAKPTGSQKVPVITPIVSTAIADGSQELPTPTATIPNEINGAQTITFDQNGQTLTFQPGDRLILMLGDGYNWDVVMLDPAVVSQVSELAPVKGSQGVFEIHQTGQTELTASGDPLCRNQKPACMAPSIIFEIKIVVE